MRKKVLVILGTRPEAIKLAPVVKAFQERQGMDVILCSTGQHREILNDIFPVFGLNDVIKLDVMTPGQSLSDCVSACISALRPVVAETSPDFIVVQGDTNSTLAGAMVGFHHRVPVGHVEAGLRTDNPYRPFPEEMNRRLTTRLSTLHFPPTRYARERLLQEGVAEENVYLTGNTVIDALYAIADQLPNTVNDSPEVLLTMHRRENFGGPIRAALQAIKEVFRRNPKIQLVVPVHPNPNVVSAMEQELGDQENIHLIAPLPYPQMVQKLRDCQFVITDSGGLQEEAPAFNKPVVVLREETERSEGVDAGCAVLVGTNPQRLTTAVEPLMDPKSLIYQGMAQAPHPYGDGKASWRIAKIVDEFLQRSTAILQAESARTPSSIG